MAIKILGARTWAAALAALVVATVAGGGASAGPSTSQGVIISQDTILGVKSSVGAPSVTTRVTMAFAVNTSKERSGQGAGDRVLVMSQPKETGANNACEVTAISGAQSAPGLCLAAYDPGIEQFSFNNAVGRVHGVDDVKFGIPATAFRANDWNYYVISFDTATGAYAVYVNGLALTPQRLNPNNGWVTLSRNAIPDLNNESGFWLGNGWMFGAYSWMADFYYNAEESVACRNRSDLVTKDGVHHKCPGEGQIPADILAKLYHGGKVMDYGPDCAGPTGSQPAICVLRGNAHTALANAGSAQAKTLVAYPSSQSVGRDPLSPKVVGVLDAPYGPGTGAPADRPFFRWMNSRHMNYGKLPTSSVMLPRGDYRIAPGDLLIATIYIQDIGDPGATYDFDVQCPQPLPGGGAWTAVKGPSANAANHRSWRVCYKAVDAADQALSTDYWNGGTVKDGWRWTFPNPPRPTYSASFAMADYGNVGSVGDAKVAYAAKAAAPTTPGGAVTNAKALAVHQWFSDNASVLFRTRPGYDIRFRTMRTWGGTWSGLADELAPVPGALPGRSLDAKNPATLAPIAANNAVTATLILNP